MAPPKAPRGLDADLESNRFDEQNLRCLKPSGSLPALDLSKFPAKKILGLGKKTVNPGPKTPKTAELGMGKGTSTRRLRNSAPQIVRAPKPAEDEVPKLKGSMAFAHKARGMGDCYQTWAAGIEEKSPPSSTKGTGRYGRMTSIEIDVLGFEDQMLSGDSMDFQSTTDEDPLEEDAWLADPKNSVSSLEMYEDTWIMDHECEPPCISSDAGNESGNCLVGYEPPRMSLGEFYDDTESIFVEHKTSSELAEKEIRNFGSVSIDGDQGEAPYIIQQALQLPSESQRCLNISTTCAKDKQSLDAASMEDSHTLPVQPVRANFVPCSAGTDMASMVKHGYQRMDRGIPKATSLDCPPPPSNQGCAVSRPSSEEKFPSVPDARLTLVPSCDHPNEIAYSIDSNANGYSVGIAYRESTESTRNRRGSLALAKKVLGVTFGITANAVMLVSGVTLAKAMLGRGDRKSREEKPMYRNGESLEGKLVGI